MTVIWLLRCQSDKNVAVGTHRGHWVTATAWSQVTLNTQDFAFQKPCASGDRIDLHQYILFYHDTSLISVFNYKYSIFLQ